MKITGQLLIGRHEFDGTGSTFKAVNPSNKAILEPKFATAGLADVDLACRKAASVADQYRQTTAEQRAIFLESIAAGIEALGSQLTERAALESGLSLGRLEGERNRTTMQLRFFAQVLREGNWQQIVIDCHTPQQQHMASTGLKMQQIALGPVAVFGASNFPLAFSVAGGDTASALAAGCPVIVKAHPSHPGTSEFVARAVRDAIEECQLPEDIFSLLGGIGHEVGEWLVTHPAIQSVGFTGSRAGGLALQRLAQDRGQPIPLYAEMSSINPVFLLPAALAARTTQIAFDFIESLTLGGGQFCTNPGLVLGCAGKDWEKLVTTLAEKLPEKPNVPMLNGDIHTAYHQGVDRLTKLDGVQTVARGQKLSSTGFTAQPVIFQTTAARWLTSPALEEEVFGPCSLLVRCDDFSQMLAVAERMQGQLTATLQIEADDQPEARTLLPLLERKAGRILVNGFPTGVEVSRAMVHGGPYPATSDSRMTSVGASAIARFLRPVCYQNFPVSLLPIALQ